MQKINLVKISLDAAMAAVFALLFNTSVIAGLTFHEIAGLSIGLAFIIHMTINRRWIRQVTRNLFGRQIAMKTRIGYFVDALLLLAMLYTIFSGIIISRVLFPYLQIGNESLFQNTHAAAAYLSLGLVGIHIGLHWQWVMNLFKKMLHIRQNWQAPGYAARIMAVLVFAVGVYCIYTTNYFSTVAMIGTSFSQSQELEHAARPDLQSAGGLQGMNSGGDSKADLPNGSRGGHGGGSLGSGIPGTLSSALGIISVFAIVSYYLEKLLIKLLTRRRVQEKVLPMGE